MICGFFSSDFFYDLELKKIDCESADHSVYPWDYTSKLQDNPVLNVEILQQRVLISCIKPDNIMFIKHIISSDWRPLIAQPAKWAPFLHLVHL
jgi:hypothetical protein